MRLIALQHTDYGKAGNDVFCHIFLSLVHFDAYFQKTHEPRIPDEAGLVL